MCMETESQSQSDELLVRQVQAGDVEAFAGLVERYEPKLMRYGRKFLQHTQSIEDLVQGVFLKAYQNIQGVDTSRKFSAWIYRIAHNEFINELRKREGGFLDFFEPDLLALFPAKDSPLGDLEKKEMLSALDESLADLDKKYREVLVLYFFEEFSYQEIADILHVPMATVGVRIKRAKEQLLKRVKVKETYGR